MNGKLIADELLKIAKMLESSSSRYCEIFKATDGKWYMGIANSEYGEQADAHYGPFSSEESAEKAIDNFSNPGGFDVDDSGRRSPPKKLQRLSRW